MAATKLESKSKAKFKVSSKKPTLVLFFNKSDENMNTAAQLAKVKAAFDVEIEFKRIEDIGEDDVKFDILAPISIRQKIKIHQTKKAKSLYPHLVIYLEGSPFTYYPQARKNEKDVTIDQFLQSLLSGQVVGIEGAATLQKAIKSKK